jgi:hypothetical protein
MDAAPPPLYPDIEMRVKAGLSLRECEMRASVSRTLIVAALALVPFQATQMSAQSITTRVDSARHEVVIDAGPFDVPAMDPEMAKEMEIDHTSMHDDEERRVFRFDWPVDGPARGYRVELRDSAGSAIPRSMLHHLIAINFDRRQFVYPAAERLFGIGRETPDIALPGTLAVPIGRGERLGFYIAWHNDTGRDLHGATVRIVMNWIPKRVARSYAAVLPIYIDVNNDVGGTNTFDVPPGKSSKAFEFVAPTSGHLLAVAGHLHDYGASIRLENAETGKVMVKLPARRDANGKIVAMPRKTFLLRPLRLREGHRYRIVAEYDSPLHETITNGAMANILGVFAPDSPSRWPEIDPSDPTFQKDIASLPIFVPQTGAGEGAPQFVTYSQRPSGQ